MTTGRKLKKDGTPYKDNRGGARPGAGRPSKKRYAASDSLVEKLVASELAEEERTGVSVADKLIEMTRADDKRTALTAIKLLLDKIVTTASERVSESTTHQGPALYLPEEQPDLAIVRELKRPA